MSGTLRLTVAEGAGKVRQGGVIAYPTEAVFGLGCDPANEQAVRRILALKSRPASAGLILIADRFDRFQPYIGALEPGAEAPALRTWPGPVTWLFPRSTAVPDWLAGSHPTIALRVTDHPLCRELCASLESALVSTSANPRGEEPARSVEEVNTFFGDRIDGVVEGALGSQAQPSQIRDLATGQTIRAG